MYYYKQISIKYLIIDLKEIKKFIYILIKFDIYNII